MSKKLEDRFNPNFAIPPGELLDEELDSRGMSQAELSERTGLSKKTINEIIKAKAPISPETALKLELVFRLPADYWLNLEILYQESLARIQEQERIGQDVNWLQNLPIKEMVKLEWIRQANDKKDQLKEVLSFFGIASIRQWPQVWDDLCVAYRKSDAFEANALAISAWLRQGELLAQEIECRPYNASKFKDALTDIRELTKESAPDRFMPRLVQLSAAAGVAVVFVPELPQTRISGATRWLGKEKAIIQLSLRYKSDDHLWFTFFHEAGHIVKHGKKEIFLEGNGMNDIREDEANAFASNFLIPAKMMDKFVENDIFSKSSIISFAEELGIAPGIVVGQLQHRKLLPYTHCNGLKVRYKWSHEVR